MFPARRLSQWLAAPDRRCRLRLAALVYCVFVAVVALVSPPELFTTHTQFNHFALQAEAWLAGRLDLGGPPPAYAGNNDFAFFAGRHYVVFPPFPALLLVPWVGLAGGASELPDGLVFLLLSGAAPALSFLALEELSRVGDSARSQRENLFIALAFGFGSVYFFTAAQGTVWFAAHVVGTGLAALYLFFSISARHPFAAGLTLGLAFATRAPLLFAAPLFVFEAVRAAAPKDALCPWREPLAYAKALDRRALGRSLVVFALPLSAVLGLSLLHNHARFAEPFEFGYRYLTVVWRQRIETWGLFSYHYLARNLGVVLTSLPWVPGPRDAPFCINLHGLALWFTTPLYLTLAFPKRKPKVLAALGAAALGAALPSLFYQNTGWLQFGYRFSNDYAIFLFALFAVGGIAIRRGVIALVLWALVVNAFGALSFGRSDYARYYFAEPSQRVLYQPD